MQHSELLAVFNNNTQWYPVRVPCFFLHSTALSKKLWQCLPVPYLITCSSEFIFSQLQIEFCIQIVLRLVCHFTYQLTQTRTQPMIRVSSTRGSAESGIESSGGFKIDIQF